MIQNIAITEKLEKKTEKDHILREFIYDIVDNEVQGKNYKKYYETAIKKALEKEKEGKK